MTQPPFRPQQAGGSIGGFGKKLKPTSKWSKAKQRKNLMKKTDSIKSPPLSPAQNYAKTSGYTKSQLAKLSQYDKYGLKKSKIEKNVPQQMFKQSGSSNIKTKGKNLVPSNKYLKEQKVKGQVVAQTDYVELRVRPKTKSTALKDLSSILGKKVKLIEQQKPKYTSQQTRQRQKTEPIRQVDYKTQVQQQTNPIFNNPSVAAKVKQQPDIFLTQQEVSNLSRNMYFKPTGTVLPTKPFSVGSTVLAVGLGGKTIVELSPALLPQKEQDEIKVLPQTDELEIQKVIEEKQTLTPQEISDLAQQTQPATVTTPLEEEERKRVKQSPVPDERETQILTKDKEDVNPFEEPFEDQLEDTGLADDLEDDTDIVEEPDEVEREVIEEPDIERPEVETVEIGGQVDIQEEIATEDETEFEPLLEEDTATDLEIVTDNETEPETITEQDFSGQVEPEETTKKKPEKELIDQPIIPTPTSTPPPEKNVTKRKPPKRKKKIKSKSETTENIFKTQKGKRPNIVNFKTRKGFFQANFKKGTVQAAPKGITLDTNQGFKEDSMKVITRTEAATKFKTRRDPLKALERKGII